MHPSNSSETLRRSIAGWLGLGVAFFLVGWSIANCKHVNEMLLAIVHTGGRFEVASVSIEVDLTPANAARRELANSVAIAQIQGPIEIVRVHPELGDGVEFIEVEARAYVDLQGGFVGDGNELLQLPQAASLRLEAGQSVIIYTYCGWPVYSGLLEHDHRMAIWEKTCYGMLRALRSGAYLDAPEATSEVIEVVRAVYRHKPVKFLCSGYPDVPLTSQANPPWCECTEDRKGACQALFAEAYARSLYSKAKGPRTRPKSAVPYPTVKEDLISADLKSCVPEDLVADKTIDIASSSTPRHCANEEAPILARCMQTSKKDNSVECIKGLPPFTGMFKNEPGEGDRILVADNRGRVVADLNYWWTETAE